MGRGLAPPVPGRPVPSSQEQHPHPTLPPSKVPRLTDAHGPESRSQARTRLAPCHLIFGLGWASPGCPCTPIWAGEFSSILGMVREHVARWNGAELCSVGAPIAPSLGCNLATEDPSDSGSPVGERGAVASGKAGKGARKRLLPEREETWELGNGKGQGHPLPTRSFLSPPPPPANTWHGHKQGLCSLPLGQDWVKEAKSRQQRARGAGSGVGGGLAGLPLVNQGGKRALPSRAGSQLRSPNRPQTQTLSPSNAAAGPEEAGTIPSSGRLEGSALPDPKPFSPPLHSPPHPASPVRSAQRLFPKLQKTQGQEQRVPRSSVFSPVVTICLAALKTAPGKN